MKVLYFLILATGLLTAQDDNGEFNIEGFVDLQLRSSHKHGDDLAMDDGAVYLTMNYQHFDVFADLPFYFDQQDDSLDYNSVKSQIYIESNNEQGFTWKVGKFDVIVGMEDNDSFGLPFTNGSAFAGSPFPTTHTGAQLGYQGEIFGAQGVVSSKSDSGRIGGSDLSYGAVINWDGKGWRGYAAVLEEEAEENQRDTVFNVVLGRDFGPLALDLEYAGTSPESGPSGYGLQLQGVYSHSSQLASVWRLEQGAELEGVDRATGWAAGLQWDRFKHMRLKLDAVYTRQRPTPDANYFDDTTLTLAALLHF